MPFNTKKEAPSQLTVLIIKTHENYNLTLMKNQLVFLWLFRPTPQSRQTVINDGQYASHALVSIGRS